MSRNQFPNDRQPDDVTPRILPRAEVERIIERVLVTIKTRDNGSMVSVQSWWNGELRWARNRVSLASDRRDIQVVVTRRIDGAAGTAVTNQLDDLSLEAAVRSAERSARNANERELLRFKTVAPNLPRPETILWSDATYNITAEQRAAVARTLLEGAEAKVLLSAGYIEMRAGEIATLNDSNSSSAPDHIQYDTYTQAQCSMTVREPRGIGSGWAGLSGYDWGAIDSAALATAALDKCVRSLNPVSIEPGRYTVILEPQAVADLFEPLFAFLNNRELAEESGTGPFVLGFDNELRVGRTKLGLKVLDERITVSHDPNDPMLGVLPQPGLDAMTWIEKGILMNLSYDRKYALRSLNENLPGSSRPAYRMSGGTTSVAEMIATTKRGLLVTRFSGVRLLQQASVLTTGVTRDGLWLVENGAITKAVKNLRFTESPLFMLNQIEELGVPTPVFRPIGNPYAPGVSPAIVPAIRASDFSFTSTVDAI